MLVEKTPIEGLLKLKPKVHSDSRGYFFESYNLSEFSALGLNSQFVQDNQSYSSYGTIRGIHFQERNHAQAKLVRVIKGEVLDVAIDLRENSPTFGRHFSVILSEDNFTQLYIPRGFGHGFSVLSQDAIFCYKCDAHYQASAESGIVFDDKELAIDWKIPVEDQLVSEKDLNWGTLRDYRNGR